MNIEGIEIEYNCEECDNRFILIYDEDGDEPEYCPFCGAFLEFEFE